MVGKVRVDDDNRLIRRDSMGTAIRVLRQQKKLRHAIDPAYGPRIAIDHLGTDDDGAVCRDVVYASP